MGEYKHVEEPFLLQLESLGWDIIKHPGGAVPQNQKISLREDFKEIVIKDIFKKKIREINLMEDGEEWLTDKQLDDLYNELTDQGYDGLIEANQRVFQLLTETTRVDKNEVTGEEYPVVKLIDFKTPENNHFLAINQYRVDTPGMAKDYIIPDIVLFVNGIPLVVVECKYTNSYLSKPMEEGIRQLLRYSNRRAQTEGIDEKEGEERLFHFNQFMISTCGDEARYGTISSSYQHFMEWKDVYPEKNQEFESPLGQIRSQERLIQGMLVPENLLDIIQNFTIYMQKKGEMIKAVCRYQQYRAACKAIERLKSGENYQKRSGIVWHTQGSGKSLTMVFIIRKLRTIDELKDYKVLVVNDRTDLEEQLGETMALTDEKVDYANSTEELKEKGATTTSNLLMVMMHKFQERNNGEEPEELKEALYIAEQHSLPEYNILDTINPSEKVLILIDEAHRTQSSTLGMNMFNSFPNSSKIAFTGTPLITDRHTKRTHDIFGTYIDIYKLNDSVKDGATLPILYEGKTVNTDLDNQGDFDKKFEDLFRDRSPEEMLEIKKKYGTMGDIFEAEKRIEAIAEDLVDHYIDNILPNGFKAQVVASSKLAAVRYQKAIKKALKERIKLEEARKVVDREIVEKLKFLKTAVVISSDQTNEDPKITRVRKEAKRLNARDNFKKPFDMEKEKTGVAFLIVCDMLLTGFDAPIEQVMYIDKRMREHNLLQAIARVNRTSKGKERGYIVDYIGIGNHLEEALEIYAGIEDEDVLSTMQDISDEIPVLKDRYYRLLDLFQSEGIQRIKDYVEYKIKDAKEEYKVLESCIELMENVHLRAIFDVHYKKFLQSMDIILPNPAASDYIGPMKAFGHIHNRIKHVYKDNTTNLMGVGNKVKRLINEHLISLGVDPQVPPTELLSEDFPSSVKQNKSKKIQASEMEHAIRKHCKVNLEKDPVLYEKFSEKLEKILVAYKDDVEERYKQLEILLKEIDRGREEDKDTEGLDLKKEAPFYDLLIDRSFEDAEDIDDDTKEKLKEVIKDITKLIIERINIVDFWGMQKEEQKKLRSDIDDKLLTAGANLGLNQLIAKKEKITCEFMDLAQKKHNELVR